MNAPTLPPSGGRATAVVVGAGIGGLAAAIALVRAGASVVVLERAAALRTGGSGLWLWPNALAALDALGAGDAVRDAGVRLSASRIADARGRTLVALAVPRRDGQLHESVGTGRGALVHALAARLAAEARGAVGATPATPLDRPPAIRFGAAVEGVTPGGLSEPAVVHLADGATIEADLVVAADGVGSTVRRALFGRSGRRDAGFTAFRAVVERVPDIRPEGLVFWGRGARFGIIPVGTGSVAWFAALDEPADLPAAEAHALVRDRLRGWPEPAEALVAATPPGEVRADRVAVSTPPPAWCVGRVALLGDAAHAMTPSLGQGAAQAIEDGVALGGAVAAHEDDLPAALAAYARRRRRRAEAVAARSALLDRVAALDHPLLCAARDEALRLLPAALVRAAQRAVWDLPAEPSRRR